MIEIEAEVMSEEDDDEFDERERMILELKNEMDYKFDGNDNMNDEDVLDEIKSDRDEKVYSSYFTEEMIAKLYSMDKVHDKDSIEYGIPDRRYWRYDSCESYLRAGSDEKDYMTIEDSESDEKAGNKIKKKGCFAFLSRVFRRLFKKN
ncbi:uncharacterized protein [Parasteatoda tepidariorum]|uniref:uncharacterized protein isoform X1 n=1 Tax=Parasteatoda tepidariorum TaxID=114398 RepID=UPI001C726BBA|nr:uncharacterized protein LOC122269782 [Parasteatoda tepidariorum]